MSAIELIVSGDIEQALEEYDYPVGFPESIDIHLEITAKHPKSFDVELFNKLNKDWRKEIIKYFDQLFDYEPFLKYNYIEKRRIFEAVNHIRAIKNMKKAREFYNNKKELEKLINYARSLNACKRGYYFNLELLTLDDIKSIYRIMKVKQPSIKKKDEFIKKLIEDLKLKDYNIKKKGIEN